MDFHILIVISCVFLASLCSLLFINKFFKRKTFEEIIAEKKALNDKIKVAAAGGPKKPKKLHQQLKKEQKREKKQRQKEQQRDTTEQEDSDGQSEQLSVDDEPKGLSKTHVEFEPDPEVLTYPTEVPVAASSGVSSVTDRENAGGNQKPKAKKDKKNSKTAAAGILVNKNEPVIVKESPIAAETLNQFEYKQPKDVVEMKKEKKEEPKQQREQNKKDKGVKKEKHTSEKLLVAAAEVQPIAAAIEVSHVAKELKQQDEKARHGSPKNQHPSHNTKAKQQNKKQAKDGATTTKELVLALDKLAESDSIGVSLLMNLFRRAELNRSEIQILIDYLLNKQQDMPASHSDWSDDICQKLKRQLEEKERALTEEQEASLGLQGKLRELRAEINGERAQLNATVKALYEKIQSKEQELVGLNQEVSSLNDKITLERQQFQSKLQLAKQAGSQDLLAQLQIQQNELAHKDKCIAELTHLVNAAQQSNEIIQTQAQQIIALEQQRDELEKESNNRIFELERSKTVETELAECTVEIRNLQNALESSKVDLLQARKDLDAAKSELTLVRTVELSEKQKDLQTLQAKNDELHQQLAGISGMAEAQSKEQSGLQDTLDAIRKELAAKEQQLAEFNAKNAELLQQLASAQQNTAQQHDLQKLIDGLNAELAEKHKQVQLAQEQLGNRERDLQQQLQEQKEKNNDLRMKNWKLVEALQNAETSFTKHDNDKHNSNANASLVQQQQQLIAATQKTNSNAAATTVTNAGKDEKQLRELFQRLCPEAVNVCAATALSLPFDQWMEQVLTTHIKQQSLSKTNAANTNNSNTSNAVAAAAANSSSNNKSTQLNSNSFAHTESNSNHTNNSNNNSTHNNSHNDSELLLNSEVTATTVNSNSRISSNNNNSNSSSSNDDAVVDVQKLNTQNAQLRAKIDELTKLVTKTSNTLSELEGRAREQDEHWRNVVHSKDEQIRSLQHSNGKQDI